MNPDITIYVALYGAILGTLGFVVSVILAINKLGENKPKIKISLHHSRLVDPDGNSSEPLIGVDVVNDGAYSLSLNSCGWLKKDRHKEVLLNLYNVSLPFVLEPRRKLNIFLAVRWYREKNEFDSRFVFFIEDETGKMWRAKVPKKMKKQWKELKIEGWKILWNKETKVYLEEYRISPSLRNQFI